MKQYNPKMHSTEHILNQTMVRMFNKGRSFSAHIEKKKSKVDYHFDRVLTENEITEIQKRVNDIIKSNLEVIEEFYPKEEAEKKFNLNKLPEDVDDNIRIIKLESAVENVSTYIKNDMREIKLDLKDLTKAVNKHLQAH